MTMTAPTGRFISILYNNMKKQKIGSNLLIIAGLLLIAAALAFTGYNMYEQKSAEVASADVLEKLLAQMPPIRTATNGVYDTEVPDAAEYWHDDNFTGYEAAPSETALEEYEMTGIYSGEYEVPDYVIYPEIKMPAVTVDALEYIAVLDIPSISISLPIISEWSYPNLKIAPCRFYGSAYTDDLVIAGHDYARHFARLRNLSIDDLLYLTDMEGNKFTYKVIEVEILTPEQSEYMVKGDWDLTLFTCTVGGMTRFTVRCDKVE